MRELRGPLVVSWLLAACGGGSHARDDAGPPAIDADAGDAGVDAADTGYVRQPPVSIPPEPPPRDTADLPRDEQGRPILAAGEHYYLIERPPDPLTALSSCTSMIVRCVDPAVPGRNLDACAISPPRCATAEPWREAAACCAPACFDRYEELRIAGTAPIAAFRQAYYGPPSCMPGVDALRGTP